MERHEILDLMGALKLSGMKAAYDDIVTAGVKRRHGAEKVIAALLQAEISAKQARSINYQMTIMSETCSTRRQTAAGEGAGRVVVR